ncbi:hypothetical protein CDAR_229691 [Caerostris darwini]|uniref:Uncharacterized protein n=1 Tax=Caerostris darwini TaxID=1538125 RepID=A0AAV4PYG4_9ARAC|nr:hypothetical protein CDAR_229691 [Caerostris darwini]
MNSLGITSDAPEGSLLQTSKYKIKTKSDKSCVKQIPEILLNTNTSREKIPTFTPLKLFIPKRLRNLWNKGAVIRVHSRTSFEECKRFFHSSTPSLFAHLRHRLHPKRSFKQWTFIPHRLVIVRKQVPKEPNERISREGFTWEGWTRGLCIVCVQTTIDN